MKSKLTQKMHFIGGLKKTLLVVLIVLGTIFSYAQENRLDTKHLNELKRLRFNDPITVKTELLSYLPQANDLDRSLRVDFYNTLALLYTEIGIHDSSDLFNKKALSEVVLLNDQDLLFSVYNAQGQIFNLKREYDSGLYYFSLMKEIAIEQNDSIKLAAAYNNMALAEENLGNNIIAYQNYIKAMELFESLDDQKNLAIIYNNLGQVNQSLGEYDRAIDFYQRAIKTNKKLNNLNDLGMNYSNIGISYKLKGEPDEAIVWLKQSSDIAHQTGSNYSEARALHNLANTYIDLNNYELAKSNYLESLKICSDNGIKYGMMLNYHGLSNLYRETENWTQAEYFTEQAINLASEFDHYPTLSEAYFLLSLINEKKGNLSKALDFYKKYDQADDTVASRKHRSFILELQTKYDTERKELENESLKLENEKQTQTIEEQKIITIIVSSALVFVMVLLFFLIRTQRSLKRANQKLNDLNADFATQNKLLEETINTKDKLFSIIGHDLRSPFNSMLGFLNLIVEDFDSFEKEEQKALITDLYKKSFNLYNMVENLLQWALQQKGEISFKPDYNDIWEILNDEITFLASRAEKKQIAINNEVSKESNVYCDLNMMQTVFRNIISNAIKFTPNGGSIFIKSKLRQHDLVISICDNGIGMDSQTIEQILQSDSFISSEGTNKETGVGLGLRIVKEFVSIHKGDFSIESEPHKGSCFYIRLNKH